MKNYIKSVCFILLYLAGNSLFAQTQPVIIPPGGPCPDINVSTGIDNAGNAIAPGATDPNWSITSGPMGPQAKRTISYLPYWQATPIAGTNACWINGSGTIFNNAPGVYVFERSFNINPGTVSFTTNFGISYDDVHIQTELVPPTGPTIALAIPPGPAYQVSPPINYTVMAPAVGTWKIRSVIRFVDEVGAYILSGTIDVDCNDSPCTCQNVHPTFTYTTDADCITTFVGTVNSACADMIVQYNWIIDGSPAGSGQVFSTALSNGTHVVCLQVIVATPTQECVKQWCSEVTIDCDPCSCDKLIPDFLYTIEKCEGHFTGSADIPCCIKEVKYEWYINGVYQYTGQNFNHTFTNNGFYNVCLYVSGTLPDGTECVKRVCKIVEVKDCDPCSCDQMVPSFTYQLFGCEAVFTSTTTVPPCMQIISEEWYINGLPVGSGPSLSYVFPANGPYNICLFVTAVMDDGTICHKEVCKQITVKDCGCNCDQLELNFDYLIDGCTGHFNGLVGLPACLQIISWDWTVNGSPAGSGPNISYTFPGNGVYNVCLMVTSMMPDGTICHKKICKLVEVVNCGCNCDQLQIGFVYEIDKCDIHLFGNAQGSPCMTDYTYQWTVNGSYVGSGQNFVWTAPSNGTYVICLFVTVTMPDGSKCYREICQTITVTDCDECTCEGLQLDYTYQIGQCSGSFYGQILSLPDCWVSYTQDWYVNGTYVTSGPSFSYAFPANGVYQVCMVVTVTLSNGMVCEDRVCRTFDVGGCGCNCSQLGGNFAFQVNGCNIFLQAQPIVPACMTGVGYTWIVNGSYAGSAPVFNYPVTGNGIYTVCLWITAVKPNGEKCEFQVCKTIVVNNCGIGTPTDPQGMAPPGPVMEESLLLYPNPASTELNIDFKTADAGTVTIAFKTADGKVILNESRDLEAGDQHLKMPISPMISDEIIFVEITTGTETIVRKVSVSKR